MKKNDLREQGYSVTERYQNHTIIGIICLILTFLLIAGTVLAISVITNIFELEDFGGGNKGNTNIVIYLFNLILSFTGFWGFLAVMVLFYFLYVGIKLLMTISVCNDKINNIKLKILEMKGMPVCHCGEALTVGQTVWVYCGPVVFMYSLLLILSLATFNLDIQTMLFVQTMMWFMCFFFAFDLTVILYTWFFKIKYKIDYIAVDFHIYQVTLYNSTYVKFGGKTNKKTGGKYIRIPESEKKTTKKMTTCANSECANYGYELEDDKSKTCPLCGKRKYPFEVFDRMTTCLNQQCKNYRQQLKEDLDICSLCGEETESLIIKFNTWLTMPAIITILATTVIFNLFYLIMGFNQMGKHPIVWYAGFLHILTYAVSVFMSILSKSKTAIIITLLSLLANAIILFLTSLTS